MRSYLLQIGLLLPMLASPLATLAGDAISPNPRPASTKSIVADDFDHAALKIRNAVRGDWEIAGGVATVSQDDALYVKHNNHGPLLIYNHRFANAAAKTRFRGKDNQAIVFTMDGETGHVVRVKMTASKPTVVLAWAKGSTKPKVLERDLPAIVESEWTDLIVVVSGDELMVSLNGSKHSFRFNGIDRVKTNAKIGFSFGSIEIDAFHLDEHTE